MKELNRFRQFINEGKENVDELFGLRGTKDQTQKAAEALDALEKALFELNFLDILGDEDYEGWLLKYEELRGRVMAGLDDESREKYDVALMDDGELDENDVALDEVINEEENQMKNLAKLLRDEADQPDNKVGKNIFLKYAAQAEKTDVKDIKSLLQKLEDELIDKHPDTFSGEDDIVGSFLSTSKNYTAEEQTTEL